MTSESLGDLKRCFGVVAKQLGDHVRLVAESLTTVSGRLDRVAKELEEQIHRESEDTRTRFRLSHVEAERRYSALETVVADLTRRIQRIEARAADWPPGLGKARPRHDPGVPADGHRPGRAPDVGAGFSPRGGWGNRP